MGGVEPQEITRVGQTVRVRLIISDIVAACQLCEWVAQKSCNSLCQPFSLEESCLPALALMSHSSVPPYMPLVLFKLLPRCCSSEGVSLSLCMGPLRGLPGKLVVSVFHSLIPHWFSQIEVIGTYLPGTGILGWGPFVGLGPPRS